MQGCHKISICKTHSTCEVQLKKIKCNKTRDVYNFKAVSLP